MTFNFEVSSSASCPSVRIVLFCRSKNGQRPEKRDFRGQLCGLLHENCLAARGVHPRLGVRHSRCDQHHPLLPRLDSGDHSRPLVLLLPVNEKDVTDETDFSATSLLLLLSRF